MALPLALGAPYACIATVYRRCMTGVVPGQLLARRYFRPVHQYQFGDLPNIQSELDGPVHQYHDIGREHGQHSDQAHFPDGLNVIEVDDAFTRQASLRAQANLDRNITHGRCDGGNGDGSADRVGGVSRKKQDGPSAGGAR